MSVLLLILGLVLFIGLVVVHEWGHFIMARRNGVKVEEFGIFFPPRLFKYKTKGGWNFTINLLPLGGFVKLKGEHDTDTAKGSYGAASVWAKTKIMGAGVFMNLVVALVLLTILAAIGLPQILDNQFNVKSDSKISESKVLVGAVEAGSPADKAGLESSDEVISVGPVGQKPLQIKTTDDLSAATKRFAGDTVNIEYSRHGGAPRTLRANLLSSSVVVASQKAYDKAYAAAKLCQDVKPPKGYLGVSTSQYTARQATWSAPIVGVGFAVQATALTFQGLGHAVAGLGGLIAGAVTGNNTARQNAQCTATSQVSGPVGIYEILQSGSLLGYRFILLIIAIISLTLAIMNILPIPALDGGRLWLTLITRGLKRPLSPRLEERINGAGLLFLLTLIALITVVDVKRFF